MTTINVNRSESLKRIKQWDWPLNKDDGTVNVVNTDQKFEVDLEAVYFQPKEIEVKVSGDHLVVRCKRESKEGQFGEIKREISRSYKLPSDVDIPTLNRLLQPEVILSLLLARKNKKK